MGALNPTEIIAGAITLGEELIGSVTGPLGRATQLGQRLGVVDDSDDNRRRALRGQQDQALVQLQQQQRLTEQQAGQDAALEKQRRAEKRARDNQRRQAALRRAVARQRAQFGSSGVGSSGGSSEAVLLGLFDETEEDKAQRQRLDSLRNRALEQDQRQLRSRNVLEATQMAQRNQLRRSANFRFC